MRCTGRVGADRIVAFERAGQQALRLSPRLLLVEVSAVTLFVSAAVRELVRLQQAQLGRRCRFAVVGMNGSAGRTLRAVGFLGESFASIEAAIAPARD